MPAQLKIDQDGLVDGTPGVSRTDGLDTGALVTLTNTGTGTTTTFRLLWVPPGDTTAVASLAPTGDPKVWTFEPTPGVYGSYRIELIENLGLGTESKERRILAVRTPVLGVVIPALGERGDVKANLTLAEQAQIDAAENNAVDYSEASLNAVPYAAWWRSIHELAMKVDSAGSIPPGTYVGQAVGWDGSTWLPTDTLTLTSLTGTATLIAYVTGGGTYMLSPSSEPQQHLFTSEGGSGPITNLQMGVDGTEPTVGFLGATAVARPSITGSNTGEHIDSLVEALVALGLVTDDRTSP